MRFFHVSTIIRCRCNDIISLKDVVGVWHSNRAVVGNLLETHFSTLYSTTDPELAIMVGRVDYSDGDCC